MQNQNVWNPQDHYQKPVNWVWKLVAHWEAAVAATNKLQTNTDHWLGIYLFVDPILIWDNTSNLQVKLKTVFFLVFNLYFTMWFFVLFRPPSGSLPPRHHQLHIMPWFPPQKRLQTERLVTQMVRFRPQQAHIRLLRRQNRKETSRRLLLPSNTTFHPLISFFLIMVFFPHTTGYWRSVFGPSERGEITKSEFDVHCEDTRTILLSDGTVTRGDEDMGGCDFYRCWRLSRVRAWDLICASNCCSY